MKHIRNGGLELGILKAMAALATNPAMQQLSASDEQKKKFLESLPKNYIESTISPYDYYQCSDTGRVFRCRMGTYSLEEIKTDKILIQKSFKNATGGWIHISFSGNQEWDLYEERKAEFFFLNKPPY